MATEATPDATTGSTTPAATTSTSGQTTAGTSPHQATSTGAATSAVQTPPGGSSTVNNGSATADTSAAATRSTQSPLQDNGAARRLARDNGNLKRDLEQARAQLAALTGVAVPAPAQSRRLPEGVTEEAIARAREEFALVFPELAELSGEEIKEMRAFLKGDLPAFRDQHKHYWGGIAQTVGRALQSEIKDTLGELSPKTLTRIYSAFRAELETNDEFFDRYQNGDPALITEFIADFKADFMGFHTRQAASTTTAASGAITRGRALPRSGTSSTVLPAGQSEAKPKDEEELHKRAFARIQERRRATAA